MVMILWLLFFMIVPSNVSYKFEHIVLFGVREDIVQFCLVDWMKKQFLHSFINNEVYFSC